MAIGLAIGLAIGRAIQGLVSRVGSQGHYTTYLAAYSRYTVDPRISESSRSTNKARQDLLEGRKKRGVWLRATSFDLHYS